MVKKLTLTILGAFITAFGLYEIHSFSLVTEGGALGLTLFLDYHFNITPALSSFVMNALSYLIAWKILGSRFIISSIPAALSFSLFYKLLERTEPIFKNIGEYPLLAAVVGAIFIGVGVGLSVRAGGAPTGDDALAMAFSKKFSLKIEWIYLFSDLTVLALSLSYIPPKRIIFSLLSVTLSSKIVGLVERASFKRK